MGIRSWLWGESNDAIGKAGREIENGSVADIRCNRYYDHGRLEQFAYRKPVIIQSLGVCDLSAVGPDNVAGLDEWVLATVKAGLVSWPVSELPR